MAFGFKSGYRVAPACCGDKRLLLSVGENFIKAFLEGILPYSTIVKPRARRCNTMTVLMPKAIVYRYMLCGDAIFNRTCYFLRAFIIDHYWAQKFKDSAPLLFDFITGFLGSRVLEFQRKNTAVQEAQTPIGL